MKERNKAVLVTGSSRGIALEMARHGCALSGSAHPVRNCDEPMGYGKISSFDS